MKPLVWSETPWFCETEFIARACGGFAKQFGYSTDKIDELRLLRRNGVTGVFTSFLENKILHRKVFFD